DSDLHRAGDALHGCTFVGPYRGSAYPFGKLCGTGVVFKLGQALLGPGSEALQRHLDLVAVATIADVVPLVDENRGLAIAGLRTLARTQKPGLRALMKVARVDPAAVDAGNVGFRLAPRINAAGRLGHPGAALELLLTEDAGEARRLADTLEELNRDRQAEGLLAPEDLIPSTAIDVVLPRGTNLTLDLCGELRRLAPFGLGNPDVTLLAPGCELGELATVGDGKHLRFRVHRDGRDAGGAIAFGQGTKLDRYRRDGRYDVAFRLQENHWNGTVSPQLVVRRVFDTDDRFDEVYGWLRE